MTLLCSNRLTIAEGHTIMTSLSVHSYLCWHNRASWQTWCSSILCSTGSQDLLFPEYKGLYSVLQFKVDWLKWYLEIRAGKTD